MPLYKTGKNILCLKNNPESFLKGITSNTLEAPNNAFLNIHGKIIATFAQKKISENEFWICPESRFMEDILSHVDRYLKLSKVEAVVLGHNVYFDLAGDYPLKDGDVFINQQAGRLLVTVRQLKADINEEQLMAFRLQNNIPSHGIDYTDDFILNVSADDFVSFTKGCFLGQEPVSKVYNRSKPTWKLVVKEEEKCSPEEKVKMTSRLKDPADGKVRGFVFIKNQ